jgi:hypothetical protein
MYRPACTLDGSFSDCERCVVLDKHPKHGITGLQWIQGTGYFGGEGLLSAGSDGKLCKSPRGDYDYSTDTALCHRMCTLVGCTSGQRMRSSRAAAGTIFDLQHGALS